MPTVTATVQEGKTILPQRLPLPDGTIVFVQWEEDSPSAFYEAQPLTAEDVRVDMERAWNNRFHQ